ncbi:MAG: hypothetical protein ACOC7N_04395 [Chloroflexota bacterium]
MMLSTDHRTAVDDVDRRLAAAKTTASEGRLEDAHRLLIQLTERQPHCVEAWLWRAATASSRQDELAALSTALQLDPRSERAGLAMYEALKRQLAHDAFLAYVRETDRMYQVRTPAGDRLAVPKRRVAPIPYPPPEPGPLRATSRWLLLALVGLLPSGLGALFVAPIALFSALRLRASALEREDRRRRRVFMAAALVIWILGLLLSLLVFIHL